MQVPDQLVVDRPRHGEGKAQGLRFSACMQLNVRGGVQSLAAIQSATTASVQNGAPTLVEHATAVCARASDYIELTKPRVTSLVVATTFTGFYLGCAASAAPLVFSRLVHTLVGTWLVAGAAAALNQVIECDADAVMRRTRGRPLPAGRLTCDSGANFAALLGVAGILELGLAVNVLAATIALLSYAIYTGLYTPMKPRTPLALVIGAVPGALPPVIGWAGARGHMDFAAVVLFAIMFFWQMPHFLAIAWMCRDDYARAGFRVLSVVDPSGVRTARQTLVYSTLLVASSLVPVAAGIVDTWYLAAVGLLDLALLALAVAFARRPGPAHGRRLFRASLAYLPLVFVLLIAGWR